MTEQRDRDSVAGVFPTATPSESVERRLAHLEGSESALVLATGMSAVACTMVALLRSGDHLLASRWLRPETRRFFETELPALGVSVTFVTPTETRGWRKALTRTTRALFIESPVDPTTRVVDLRPARTLAEELGIALVVDSTQASPHAFRPLAFGADVVLHDASRYLDGHHDGFAGVVCGTEAVIDEIRVKMRAWGAEPHPAAIEGLKRGLTTLAARVDRQQGSAQQIAAWAAAHAAVRRVDYPGLATHPDFSTAQGCMLGGGSLMVLDLAGGASAVARCLGRLLRIPVVTAEVSTRVAGVFSTASAIPASPEYDNGAIRLHIGAEELSLLLADLTQALE